MSGDAKMSGQLGLVLPTMTSYLISVAVSAVPKLLVIILASFVAAFRADLFSSRFFQSGINDLPVEICFYSEDNGDYRGDRICNNALANAIVSILVAMALMMIDLIIPCLTVTAFTRVAHQFTVLWAALMTAYWCVTGSLLSDLYDRFSDDDTEVLVEGDDRQERFRLFPIFSYLCMFGWIVIGVIALIRMFVKRSAVKCLSSSTDI